jgi:hypothetical protein
MMPTSEVLTVKKQGMHIFREEINDQDYNRGRKEAIEGAKILNRIRNQNS